MTQTHNGPTPENIMKIGMGFWPSKVLLSAVELGLFTELAKSGPKTLSEVRDHFDLRAIQLVDFMDVLAALGFLVREGNGPKATYGNAPDADVFLDQAKPSYIGGILEMANQRLYPFWGDLTAGLKTGEAQNEIKHSGEPMFAKLYSDPARLDQFLRAMAGVQMGNFMALSEKHDFSKHAVVLDVGGAGAAFSIACARRHPGVKFLSFDLPEANVIARRNIEAAGLSDRIEAVDGDFFTDALPKADAVVMGNILHDWNLEKKRMLVGKAHAALSDGGVFITIENIIDDARRENVFGMLMSVNMLIELGDGFDYTGAQLREWCKDAGFQSTEIVALAGPSSAGISRR